MCFFCDASLRVNGTCPFVTSATFKFLRHHLPGNQKVKPPGGEIFVFCITLYPKPSAQKGRFAVHSLQCIVTEVAPYAERHVRWCERSENEIGGKLFHFPPTRFILSLPSSFLQYRLPCERCCYQCDDPAGRNNCPLSIAHFLHESVALRGQLP